MKGTSSMDKDFCTSRANLNVRCASCARRLYAPGPVTYLYALGNSCTVFNDHTQDRTKERHLVLVCSERCFDRACARMLLDGWGDCGPAGVETRDSDIPYTYQMWRGGGGLVTLVRFNWSFEAEKQAMIAWATRVVADEKARIIARMKRKRIHGDG